MARKIIPSNSILPEARERIPLSKRTIGITIKNSPNSDGNLLIGMNSDEAIESVLPGQELSIGGYSANEPYYLDHIYIMVDWEAGTTIKTGFLTIIKDGGKIEDCD